MLRFTQVDVFTTVPTRGNALAVVHDADDLSAEEMAAFARWTNLSETTFLCRPRHEADYAVRIFTPAGELPFAGHPTLGSAHAWLEAGGVPAHPERVVQECGVGLVTVRRGARLAFAAPDLLRDGPVADADLAAAVAAFRVPPHRVVGAAWVDNGPGWLGLELASADDVLAVEPDRAAASGMKVTLLGRHTPADAAALGCDVEVRAFYSEGDVLFEDPVTGSANAGLAQWLVGAGRLPDRYVAGQGRLLGRDGRVHVEAEAGRIWVGGDVVTCVSGTVRLR